MGNFHRSVNTSSDGARRLWDRVELFMHLVKPRMTLLLLSVAEASYLLHAGGDAGIRGAALLAAGVVLLATGVFSLNQYRERHLDARMERTGSRPLPSGRMRPTAVLRIGVSASALSVLFFAFAENVVAAAVACLTVTTYLLLYTPLKTRSVLHVIPGAVAGATPPLLGWAAAGPTLDLNALVLFLLLFFWQVPHFLAIEVIHARDYRNAGVRVLPLHDPGGRRMPGVLIGSMAALLATSVIPVLTGLADPWYLWAAAPLGLAYLASGLFALGAKGKAGVLFRTSLLYLPALFLVLVLAHHGAAA